MFSCWFKAKYKSNGESEDLWAMAFFKMLAKQVWRVYFFHHWLITGSLVGKGVYLLTEFG